jgi:hypothetical protein
MRIEKNGRGAQVAGVISFYAENQSIAEEELLS